MQNSRALGRFKSFPNPAVRPEAFALAILALIATWGCGGGQYPISTPAIPITSATHDALVSGQYNLILTSTNGHGTVNIYTDFSQTGSAFSGSSNTLVCPSNHSTECQGEQPSAESITPSGTVSGQNITITISIPASSGMNTLSMVGTASVLNFAGSYTDSIGDTGTWTGSPAVNEITNSAISYEYGGTFNSTSDPLLIPAGISVQLAQDLTADPYPIGNFNVKGTAALTNFPCISSLALTGQVIGDAMILTDATNMVSIIAVPAQPTLSTGNNFNFSYKFEATAPHCAANSGTGMLALTSSPFDY
jgi:hypothetical protein